MEWASQFCKSIIQFVEIKSTNIYIIEVVYLISQVSVRKLQAMDKEALITAEKALFYSTQFLQYIKMACQVVTSSLAITLGLETRESQKPFYAAGKVTIILLKKH